MASSNAATDLPKDVEGQAKAEYKGKQAATKAALAKEPKVKVRVQEDTHVQINGVSFLIKGKSNVEVPKTVADVLEQAERI